MNTILLTIFSGTVLVGLLIFIFKYNGIESIYRLFKSRKAYNIGVYYYPWFEGDLDTHFHRPDRNLRKKLTPSQQPKLGWYDSSDPQIILEHIKMCKYSGINFWAISWWGMNNEEPGHDNKFIDGILKNNIISVLENNTIDPNLKFAIHYEKHSRTTDYETDPYKPWVVYNKFQTDMEYLALNYFNHPNYLRVNGKPVVFVYLTRKLAEDDNLLQVINDMRSGAGTEIYIVGDHAYNDIRFPDPYTNLKAFNQMHYLDAITNYDIYGSMKDSLMFAEYSRHNAYFDNQEKWRDAARSQMISYVPGVTPGNTKAGISPLSRMVRPNSNNYGSLFKRMIRQAKNQTDESIGNMIMITSWNEWEEDSQIEPTVGGGPISSFGEKKFEDYGYKYLNILKEELS